MPHDLHHNDIYVGDVVLVPMVVDSVSQTGDACNCNLTVLLNGQNTSYRPTMAANSRQILKVDLEGTILSDDDRRLKLNEVMSDFPDFVAEHFQPSIVTRLEKLDLRANELVREISTLRSSFTN